jgi:hypothetical protein
MPRVLHKLRIDEISCVDRGAGDGTKITLYKRDGEHARNNEVNMTKNTAANHFVEVCKKLGDGDPSIIVPSEHELTAHIMKYASDHRLPGESQAAAFNRIYNEQTDDGLALRKAIAATKRHAGFPLPL